MGSGKGESGRPLQMAGRRPRSTCRFELLVAPEQLPRHEPRLKPAARRTRATNGSSQLSGAGDLRAFCKETEKIIPAFTTRRFLLARCGRQTSKKVRASYVNGKVPSPQSGRGTAQPCESETIPSDFPMPHTKSGPVSFWPRDLGVR